MGGIKMAIHALTTNFNYFFKRLNPSDTFIEQAAREQQSIRALIEGSNSPARILSPKCFLQGSYRQETAIYTINDVDIVVLCSLWQPGAGGTGSRSYTRDEIFDIIASPLIADGKYKNKIRYNKGSMCIKIDLGIKVEILPVVFKQGNYDANVEPFRLYRPEVQQWDDGYARYHQQWLTWKNGAGKTEGNFKPAIKVFKHLRSLYKLDTVSFHIESFLFSLPDIVFIGSPSDYITKILNHITNFTADEWCRFNIKTPCGERSIFNEDEWSHEDWNTFYNYVKLWAKCANLASSAVDLNYSVECWQLLLGDTYFPKKVNW
jgi:hypothetical protein